MLDISKEIANALSEYTNEVAEGIEEIKEKVAKETVNELKATSPKDSGDYAKGWRAKKVGNAWVVHNKTDYQLTHLLEHGHANRDGGRTQGIEHIEPAERKAIDDYTSEVGKVIKG